MVGTCVVHKEAQLLGNVVWPAPQLASVRGRRPSCARTPAAECTGQTQAHGLQPASNQQDIELDELGAEWLASSDKPPSVYISNLHKMQMMHCWYMM